MTPGTTLAPEPVEIDAHGTALRGQWWHGDSLVAVLLHAPGDDNDLDRWRPLIPFLLGIGASVLAVDLRGHGASDGEWDADAAIRDVVATVGCARTRGAKVIVCAEGAAGLDALRAAERIAIDGAILLSPAEPGAEPPRGAGVPKLLVAGSFDDPGRQAIAVLRVASIGPALSVLAPTADSGVDLLTGDLAATCREHILAFLNERRLDTGPVQRSAGASQDRLLEVLGMRRRSSEEKGVTE